MKGAWVFAWFIFNLHTKSHLYLLYIIHNQSLIKTPCQGKKEKENPYLRGGPVFWCWIPIHSGPLSGSNCPTPWIRPPFNPFPPLQSYYTIYNDDINNYGLLRLGQLQSSITWAYMFPNWFYIKLSWEKPTFHIQKEMYL